MLQSISISPQATGITPTGLLVALHGWGANAQDLASLVPLLKLPTYQFIFLEAPFPHPAVADGRAWYDLNKPGAEGLVESRELLQAYLQDLPQQTGIALDKTILMGFSQGGAMTMDVGLGLPLAGLVVLSGYLHPFAQQLPDRKPPTLLVHGKYDQVVPIVAAQSAQKTLTKQGVDLEYEEYEMGHEITLPVIDRVREFIADISDLAGAGE
ncbi:phospholipase/Carboxylesterase [Thalassoporum mexicanum PCC 7367]|uniref:alpha/beta hydrolase n=1 Tax=Thalassoporum mexicanum TaxID=3457544 RepID=UPI00029FC5C2|nr:alpha/beta hydrolase [Pseudanabaena sp. PCC 7367]AFY70807.1 phospholipase/Carboxylesterase [Pseudanabaena sp. PCC 7367]